MSLFIGILTTVVSAVLSWSVLSRYRSRGGTHLLLWGLGLALYVVAGLAEMVLALGWNDTAFRLWYWSGALLIPPVLGQGTLHLLVRKRGVAAVLTSVVAYLSVAALIWIFTLPLDAEKFKPEGDIVRFLTESYRAILPNSPVRRVLPPIMNGYGTLLLAGGAVYSSYLFWRKQIMPNRVVGNVFIALGGLLPALGGVLVKYAEDDPTLSGVGSILKYLGILSSVILLFIGFRYAVAGAPTPANQS
ncbi:MAG: hypothetical protein KIH69_009720 [Anaerolineae bacterium]|nr:hypothetical protein [Anaerolineae bacterium]